MILNCNFFSRVQTMHKPIHIWQGRNDSGRNDPGRNDTGPKQFKAETTQGRNDPLPLAYINK